jgi:hypothetical protein
LRRELDRIVEGAPAVDLPDDTWRRARRSVVRDRVLAGGAVAAVALVVGAATWLPDAATPPVADTEVLGVPDHIYRVPDHLGSDDRETDLAIGRGAAASLEISTKIPVVVGAADGEYHLLDLPGYGGNSFMMAVGLHPATIALSPDGRLLAYSWAEFGEDAATEPIPSGIRVLDLETGEVEAYALPGGEGTAVENIVWSPSGTWLGWAGARVSAWTAGTIDSGTGAVGRIRLVDGSRDELVDQRWTDASVGVGDDGELAIGTQSAVRYWDGETLARAGFASPPERRVAASTDGRWAFPGSGVVTIQAGEDVKDLDASTPGDFPEARPLGWVGDDIVVATYSNDGNGFLMLVPENGGRPRRVSVVDTGTIADLSVAVDLMNGDRPTVPRSEPDWPLSDGRKVAIGAVVSLLLVGLASWLWARRRYRVAK